MVIGLTGPTGSGKSEISKYLKREGFFIIDCDEIVRNLYINCKECIDDVERHFEGVVENNVVNTKKLASIVFSDKELLLKLCDVVNPYILDQIKIEIEINDKDCRHAILDAPTLFESGAYRLCNYSLAVLSEKQIRLKRILNRDSISCCDAMCRINMQPRNDFYMKYADEIVFNNSKLCDCIRDVENVLRKWL